MAIENIQEITSYLNENRGNQEVEDLIKSYQLPYNLDGVKSFLEQDSEGVTYLQSYSDKKVTKALNTYKENNFKAAVEQEILKRNPQKTAEQLKLEEFERKFEAMEKEKAIAELKLKYMPVLSEKGLSSFSDFILSDSEEVITKRLEAFENSISPLVDARVGERIKEGAHTPPKGDEPNKITKSELLKMSLSELSNYKANNPAEYDSIMQG